MLTAEQREEFEQRGFVRLPGAFARRDASAMEDLLWAVLGKRYGARRNDPQSWTVSNVTGLQRLRTHSVFEPIGSTAVLEAIDDLLGVGRWRRPRHWGSFLITFPVVEHEWTVPSRSWHTDYGFLAPDLLFGLLVFSFLSDVPRHTGATVAVVGSHRLVAQFVEKHPRKALAKRKFCREAFLHSDSWLKALTLDGGDRDRVDLFMESDRVISGVPLRVVELTAEAGDVILGHPWLLHTSAPNCGTQPRFMRVQRISVERPGALAS